MTKDEFIQKCIADYQCTLEDASRWCEWADELPEYDSVDKVIPDTGEGKQPFKTAEVFLDEFSEHLDVINYCFGTDTTEKVLRTGCYFPWEMFCAAKFIDRFNNLWLTKIFASEGFFEESSDEEKEYNCLKNKMENSQENLEQK